MEIDLDNDVSMSSAKRVVECTRTVDIQHFPSIQGASYSLFLLNVDMYLEVLQFLTRRQPLLKA